MGKVVRTVYVGNDGMEAISAEAELYLRQSVESWVERFKPTPEQINDVVSRITLLEAALPQWQPIETAPKDNTPILVPTNAHSDGIVIVRWYTYNGLAAWRDWDEDVHFPTHWMPLPQPPGE